MNTINLLEVNFENIQNSELEKLSEVYDNELIDIFLANIKTNYNLVETELELRSFQNKYQYGGISNTLNKHQFSLLIDFFDNHRSFTPINKLPFVKNTLDISIHSNNYVDPRDDISNLRFTIENQTNIRNFVPITLYQIIALRYISLGMNGLIRC
jgi:hypothetical protein